MSRSKMTFVLALMASLSLTAGAQILTCSEAGSGDCHAFHYHVQSYDDVRRGMVELYGTNRFSTLEACEAEKTRRMAAEKQAVTFVLRQASRARVKESNFGPCHCDQTSDQSSRYFLNDDARFKQMHLQREMTLQLLEEAYDKGLTTDSAVAEALASRPTSFAASMWPSVAEVPPDSSDRFLAAEAPEPMQTTVTAVQNSQLDTSRYQLADIGFGEEVPLATFTVEADGAGISPATAFVNDEIATVQSYLPAVLDLPEGSQKEELLELIQQRLQMLSNLGRLVQTAGSGSALSGAMSNATTAAERDQVIGRLFGETVRSHWAPEEPSALLVRIPDAISIDPVAVLRDAGNRFSEEQKELALYVFLMRTGALTENQEIWLSGLIESRLGN